MECHAEPGRVILSEAKDLLKRIEHRQQILLFAQDDSLVHRSPQ